MYVGVACKLRTLSLARMFHNKQLYLVASKSFGEFIGRKNEGELSWKWIYNGLLSSSGVMSKNMVQDLVNPNPSGTPNLNS